MTITNGSTVAAANGFRSQAAQYLERCAHARGVPLERPAIVHALRQAIEAMPADGFEHWWEWMLQAGASLGMPLRAIDCTPDWAVELARHGVILCALDHSSQAFDLVVLHGVRGRRVQVLRGNEVVRMGVSELSRHCSIAADRQVRWVIAESASEHHGGRGNGGGQHGGDGGDDQGHDDHHSLSPLARTVKVLSAEWSDIWMVVVFALFVGILALATPIAVEALVNTVAFGQFTQPVIVLALLLFIFLTFAAAIRALQTYVVELLQRRLFARVAGDLAWRIPHVEQATYDREDGRELVNRFFDIVTVQKATALLLLDGVAIVISTLVGMAVIAFYHPWMLGFDLFLLALIAFMIFVLGRGAVRTSINESKAKYAIADWLEQLARCSQAFRLDRRAEFAVSRADRLVTDWLNARGQHFRIVFRQILFALGLQALGSTVLLALGGWLVVRGQLTLGQLVAAELIVAMILSSFSKLGKHFESFYDLLTSVDKLGHLFDLPLERQLGLLSAGASGQAEVRAHRLTYRDPETGAWLLGEVSLHVRPGEALGVTGEPGSGKSLLCDILFGLRQPSSGHVTLEHLDLRDLQPDALREKVVLLRDLEVIPATIAENLHLGSGDWTAGELREALDRVGLLEKVSSLPRGISTRLNPQGAPLSAGAVRRLMIARALLRQPRLLIIDGLLDAASDDEIPHLFAALRSEGCTLLVVSGRRAILDACDRVQVLSAVASGEVEQC